MLALSYLSLIWLIILPFRLIPCPRPGTGLRALSYLSRICLIVPPHRLIPLATRPVCLPAPASCASPTDRALALTTSSAGDPPARIAPFVTPSCRVCVGPRTCPWALPPHLTPRQPPLGGVWSQGRQAQWRAGALVRLYGPRPSSPIPPDLWYPSANAHQPNRPMNPAEQTQLRDLLTQGRVLALAVLVEGLPYAGLLPFAAPPDLSHLLILASDLAAHTQGLSDGAPYSALIHQPDGPSLDPHQVPRITLRGAAQRLPRDVPPYAVARATYLGKFPASEQLFGLGDFNLYALQIESARYVAGFGRAFTLSAARLREVVGGA